MIVVERPDISSAWAATLEAVIDAGGSAVNVITSWPGTAEVPAVRDLLDQFISSQRRNGLAGMIKRIRSIAAQIQSSR